METQLNSVTLRGIIGSVRTQDVQGHKMAHFTVATNYAYKLASGEACIETTWSSVVFWGKADSKVIDQIQKGQSVEVSGRIRTQRYTAADGSERSTTEILARDVRIIEGHLLMESAL